MWPLKMGSGQDKTLDNTLVLSFVEQTRVLTLAGEEVEETEVSRKIISEKSLSFNSLQRDFQLGSVTISSLIEKCFN